MDKIIKRLEAGERKEEDNESIPDVRIADTTDEESSEVDSDDTNSNASVSNPVASRANVAKDGLLEKLSKRRLNIKNTKANEYVIEKFNTRALLKEDETYRLETFEKNYLIIFNQVTIKDLEPRLGTEIDVEELTKTFKQFNFDVKEHKNFTRSQILHELETFSGQDFSDYGCIAIAILTHGIKGGDIYASDALYNENDIIEFFKVKHKPTLYSKPIILIVQACRGKSSISGVTMNQSVIVRDDGEEVEKAYSLPVLADMLILHSSYPGTAAHRDKMYGSWFIQSLCSKINQLAYFEDLESILISVKREVAIDCWLEHYNLTTKVMDLNKQMPVVTSSLMRKLHLRKYGDAPFPGIWDVSRRDATPCTPVFIPGGRCACFQDHFTYLLNCLKHYLVDNPEDTYAQWLLTNAATYADGVPINAVKEQIFKSKSISEYLMCREKNSTCFKYFYAFKYPSNM